jgi:phenylacetate-CoA ligase
MNEAPITDADRYPTLSEHGRVMLQFLREHPNAPIYRNESGNRLRAEDVARVRDAEREVLAATIDWQPGRPPVWVEDFVRESLETVPYYRRYGLSPADLSTRATSFGTTPDALSAVPTINRADLGHDIAQFVPDPVDVSRLINFRTSGTTGHPLLLASDPVVAAGYLAYHKRALRRVGVELRAGRGQVGVVLLGMQSVCFTYVSVTPTMAESGLAKINLHPRDWRDVQDRAKYLDALAPEVIAGDPISFAELLELNVRVRPRALLSTSMALQPALRARLANRFECPVLDLYSLNEAGPIAVDAAGDGAHALLQPRMYVEILDSEGRNVPAGMRGEITLTGGFNFCLPLLRYRTGDYASLERRGADLVLVGLEGRPPVRYRTARGEWINNIEVTHALRRYPLAQFALHQEASGALRFRWRGAGVEGVEIEKALRRVFGAEQSLGMESLHEPDGKVVQYTSDMADAKT